MLPDMPEVKDVLFGENGVAYSLSAGKLVIDMSSICRSRPRNSLHRGGFGDLRKPARV
jgi:3-hydroxyisobutyrate dehydrogenase-like beta-hydroxyacid dehydrogenase